MIRRRYTAVMAAVWTAAVCGIFARNALHLKRTAQALAIAEARQNYHQDKAAGSWAAFHGGIYVPVAENAPPIPEQINIPESHLVTSGSNHPASTNPAKLSGPPMDLLPELFGVRAHIVTFRRFSIETVPDEWEKKALLALAKGRPEAMGIAEIGGESYLRLMRPLKNETSCLRCHPASKLPSGAIRGGVSLSIPLKPYQALWHKDMSADVISFGMLWLLGLAGLAIYDRKFSTPARAPAETEASQSISQNRYKGCKIDAISQGTVGVELTASERELQELADGLIELREIEHERFARDIHENIAQCLSAIKLQIESVVKEGIENQCCETHQRLQPVIIDVQHTMGEIRKIARQYNPIGWEHMGILPSLAWLCTRFESTCPGIRIEKAFHMDEADIPEALKIIIFRMVEQMLNSVSNQSAPGVKIGLDLIASQIVFCLHTNVCAFDSSRSPDDGLLHIELAMTALKRRIEKYGGSFQLSSEPKKGTALIAIWNVCCRYPGDSPENGVPISQDSKGPGIEGRTLG